MAERHHRDVAPAAELAEDFLVAQPAVVTGDQVGVPPVELVGEQDLVLVEADPGAGVRRPVAKPLRRRAGDPPAEAPAVVR